MVDNSSMDTSDPTGAAEASAAATLLASVALGSAGVSFPPAQSISPLLPNPLPAGYNKDLPICQNCSTQVRSSCLSSVASSSTWGLTWFGMHL